MVCMQAELLQQLALLQQADVEAKRRQEHDRGTLIDMYGNLSNQMGEVQLQLGGVLSSRDSTGQLLRQVLWAVEGLRVELGQQRLDSRTAEALQQAMAAAAASAAAALQQQQHGALAGEVKVRC